MFNKNQKSSFDNNPYENVDFYNNLNNLNKKSNNSTVGTIIPGASRLDAKNVFKQEDLNKLNKNSIDIMETNKVTASDLKRIDFKLNRYMCSSIKNFIDKHKLEAKVGNIDTNNDSKNINDDNKMIVYRVKKIKPKESNK